MSMLAYVVVAHYCYTSWTERLAYLIWSMSILTSAAVSLYEDIDDMTS